MPINNVKITTSAYDTLALKDIYVALVRLQNRDFGNIDEDIKRNNTRGMLLNKEVIGIYVSKKGIKFYIKADLTNNTIIIYLSNEQPEC